MTESSDKQEDKQIDENVDKQEDKQKEKDPDRPKSRMDQLQEEFHMSDSEVEGLTMFIKSTKNSDMLGILEEIIKCETLNTRQKVAFAHAIGIFRSEETMSIIMESSLC